jgi:nucleotide-binding universal stress UspA family protein
LRIKQPVLVVPDHEDANAAKDAPAPGHRMRLAVGIDQSQTSLAAVDWVRRLRKNMPCDVVLIHLYWPAAEYARLGLTGPRSLVEPDPETIQLLQKSLSPVIGTLPGEGETTLRILPNWGSTGERLVEEAARAGADLLVLGNHHRHAFARLWHGSTVPPAVHTGRIPVLCVSQASAEPAAKATIPPLRSVVAATDLSELGNDAVAHAYALVRAERGGMVHLLYVHERALPVPAYALPAYPGRALSPAEDLELRARLMALVPSEATAAGILTDVTIVDGGDAAEVICQTAARLSADAICVASHGRGGLGRAVLGSVAGRLLHRADRPVFVVRRPAEDGAR